MKKILHIVIIAILLLPLQSVSAAGTASNALALKPLSMTHQSGSAQGNLNALYVRNQNWDDDNPARYVRFLPSSTRYKTVRSNSKASSCLVRTIHSS